MSAAHSLTVSAWLHWVLSLFSFRTPTKPAHRANDIAFSVAWSGHPPGA